MSNDPRKLLDLGRGTLDPALFNDRDLYRTELQQIFGRCWLFLGHEAQIKNPGEWVRTRMGNQSIILLRNTDGKLRAFINTCRHAGYRLCPENRGSATQFQCALHGWTYDLDGKFVTMPGYERAFFSILNRDEWGLIVLRALACYRGLLFGTFDDPAEPFDDFMVRSRPALDSLAARAELVDLGTVVYKWNVHTNWKVAVDHLGDDDFLLFPNASFSHDSQILHLWHPINQLSTELWAYVLADGDASDQVMLDLIARDEQVRHATAVGYGAIHKTVGKLDACQRAFYEAWTTRMTAPTAVSR